SSSASVISAKSTVTCLYSPSRTVRDVRIVSTRAVGGEAGGTGSGGGMASSRCPHPGQNVAGRGTTWPQAWQVSAAGVPQATQNRAVRRRGWWHLAQRQEAPSSWSAGLSGTGVASPCGGGAGLARWISASVGTNSGG